MGKLVIMLYIIYCLVGNNNVGHSHSSNSYLTVSWRTHVLPTSIEHWKLRPQIATFLQIFCFKRMLRSSCPHIIQCSLEGFVWKTLQLVGRQRGFDRNIYSEYLVNTQVVIPLSGVRYLSEVELEVRYHAKMY